ncbi:MAG: phage portal protein [Caulobacterales bacterium]|nr:phage portal protein [Caulobacterales bacterium]
MSIVGRIIDGLRAIGRTHAAAPGGRRVIVRARYDAAQTTTDNHRHWSMADGLSANAATAPQVRRTLRNRTRYEVANNSYAKGIVLTLANDTVGTGPRLQLTGIAGEDARQIEQAFMGWAVSIDLAEKLRVMRMAQAEDGEGFALFISNPLVASPVKLDLRLIEADQVATPLWYGYRPSGPEAAEWVDGIIFDLAGNPTGYHLLDRHPGDIGGAAPTARVVEAATMLHLFRADRPGQRRGVPELTPALPLFAQLRRYTMAVIAAAETAADYAGIVYTDAPAGGEADQVEPMDSIHLEKRSLLTMPGGWKMEQMRAEQPTTTYAEFKHEILNEIARCLNMPFNVAAGNSSGYNYASGRLDHQVYFKAIRVDQTRIAGQVLDRIFAAWVQEAMLIEGFLPQRVRSVDTDWTHQWFWDGHEHVDPAKEANAQATRLTSLTTTLADEYARKGQDWESQLRQRAREMALTRLLGLELKPAEGAPVAPAPSPTDAPNPDAGDAVDA